MDKIKVKVSKRSNVQVSFFGVEVLVNPMITIPEQRSIQKTALTSMFTMFSGDMLEKWDEYIFEFSMRYAILNLKTNIDFSEMEDDELNEILWGEFYEKVSSVIINYDEVVDAIYYSLDNEIRRYEVGNSLSGVLNSLVEKVLPLIERFKNISPEELEKLKTEANEMIEKIKEAPVAGVLADMDGNKPLKKKAKKG
jgi:hypothetical protein